MSLFRRKEMAQIIANTHKPPYAECQDNVALILSVPDIDEMYKQLRHQGVELGASQCK